MAKRSCAVHDGTFHADEVTACALLLLFDQIDRDKIYRTRDPKILEECEFVCDVGGIYDATIKRFDHHQAEYSGPLSSAGMVLKHLFEQQVMEKDLYEYLNRSLVMGIDAVDNGLVTPQVGHCSFSAVISNYVPIQHDVSKETLLQAFFEAMDFVYAHLKRLIGRFKYIFSCKGEVEKAMKEGRDHLFFEKSLPWMDAFFELGGEEHPALFIVMPAGEHWKLRGIPPSLRKRMQVRQPLPKKWAGLLENELKKVSGISGAIFCHKGRFISIWETKEDAMKALASVLKK